MLLMATSCLTLASCGDDDDEQGNENTKKCYIDTDGRHVDFKYAYLSIDEPSYSGGLYEYELEFSNIDYFYYTKKQEEIIGKKVFSIYITLNNYIIFYLLTQMLRHC